jgi:hypothetical protein
MTRSHYHLLTPLILIILLATFLVFSYPRVFQVFSLDDTYIHLVYARNLAQGLGFSFNAGEPSIGTTSPLWVVLLSLFFRLGLNIYYATIFLSLLIFLGCGLLVGLLAKDLLSDLPCEEGKTISLLSLFCASLYLFNGNIHWYLFSGMETMLFHFFSLLSIYLYRHHGLTVKTGLSLGLLLLTRITEGTLIVAIGIVDLFRGRRGYTGYGAILLVYLPYLIFSYLLTGNLIPTTAQGKTLTWVDGQFRPFRTASFLFACLKYLFLYNPQIFLLLMLTAVLFGFRVWILVRRGRGLRIREGREENYLLWVIILWGIFHVGIYAITFRTLAHHLRYVSGIYPVIILLSAFCLAQWAKRWRVVERWLLPLFVTAVLMITIFNLRFWKEVYKGNIEQIEKVYIKAAEWVRDNTSPSDRIAGFDIGILKYISNREIIDLGGLVNPEVYPFLILQNCGDYLRQKKATYILYSRFPDCDLITGIYRSEYGERRLLKQKQVASFSIDYYLTPTITHSFELDVFRIEAWLMRDFEGVREQFVPKEARYDFPVHHVFKGEVELLGYDLDRPEFTVVKGMAQAIYLTYYWRKVAPSRSTFFVRTTFSNPITHQLIIEKYHIPTHKFYPVSLWRSEEIVREHHLIWVPDAAPPGEYEIRVNLVRSYKFPDPKWKRKGIIWLLKDLFGLDSFYFPKDEAVKQDFLIGKFKVSPSILKPIRFKYKRF